MTHIEQIAAAVERLAHLFKAIEWDVAFPNKLTPLQRQILWFVHTFPHRARATYMAQYFGVRKPTISIAISLLVKKGLLTRHEDPHNRRSDILHLTDKAQTLLENLHLTALQEPLQKLTPDEQQKIRSALYLLLERYLETGLVEEVYMCRTCGHYQHEPPYCLLLRKSLPLEERRTLCPEHTLLQGSPPKKASR
ncbi:MAG: MarR family transcriptional regulator [Bacteroidia bacterium]|nr:MarR family transcriptional regulator [Bacteroidia bacterium]GIV23124.1 MAG: hypothetical protein KatS3mg025_0783 [Bacteroidia bacterium]